MAHVITITTPLGNNILLFHSMTASEALGRLFEYNISVLSEKNDIDPDKLLGKNVTVKLELPEGGFRCFDGYVTRFGLAGVHGRYYCYQITGRPWLWLLTRTSDCRIFQAKKVPEVIKEIFNKYPSAVIEDNLTGTYQAWTYCVQYRETDFNFVSRLMEQEGIYYYFKHSEGKHTLVLADSYSAHSPFQNYAQIPYIGPGRPMRIEQECINDWVFSCEIQPGAYVIDDYDFERPSVELQQKRKLTRNYAEAEHEYFDYPGEYVLASEGEHYAQTRLEELQAQYELVNGGTNARGMAVGHLFELTGQPRVDQNREYLVVSANHNFATDEYESTQGEGARYSCRFMALASKEAFRPTRTTRKPIVQGPQTAIVVGPAGDEIYTDKYGRVKAQFHWDRYGKRDENSSCWMRVSHPWAGKGWGSVSVPRIGQEVIVDFLEGDPDQPIITGRVYNAESMPPYSLPGDGMVSGLKSNSTPGGGGYNEISANDTKGKEKITIHGQYDMNTTVEHDQTTTVRNNRTDSVDVDDSETIGNSQKLHVGVNRTETVGGAENITITGHRTETVNGGETVTINGVRGHTVNGAQTTTISLAEMHSVGAGRMHNVGAAEAVTVGGAQMVSVGGAQMVSVGGVQKTNVGALQSFSIGGPHKLSAAVINQTSKGPFKIKAGATLLAEAPTIILKAGGSKIIMNSSGITIKGAKLTLKADGSASFKAGGSIKIKGSNLGED
ncbi:type VI secretion system Vgr family protein [Nitrosospira sp. Nsp13]|uniref:type VI secretion system Vgr family protein n=1 Tax=Nitrosospira sp. Nsp13 TaxID=1855332 RepID=UPI00087EBD78|nr:type VI secretion system tip protein VgrG [Nitrosospira sp. Nsp13]SCX77829.1 type VI secretion system secreted protein VgrG [Nitrosospira sp. Nsp13]